MNVTVIGYVPGPTDPPGAGVWEHWGGAGVSKQGNAMAHTSGITPWHALVWSSWRLARHAQSTIGPDWAWAATAGSRADRNRARRIFIFN